MVNTKVHVPVNNDIQIKIYVAFFHIFFSANLGAGVQNKQDSPVNCTGLQEFWNSNRDEIDT